VRPRGPFATFSNSLRDADDGKNRGKKTLLGFAAVEGEEQFPGFCLKFCAHPGRPRALVSGNPGLFMCPCHGGERTYRDGFAALRGPAGKTAGWSRIRTRAGGYGYEFKLAQLADPGIPQPPLFSGKQAPCGAQNELRFPNREQRCPLPGRKKNGFDQKEKGTWE